MLFEFFKHIFIMSKRVRNVNEWNIWNFFHRVGARSVQVSLILISQRKLSYLKIFLNWTTAVHISTFNILCEIVCYTNFHIIIIIIMNNSFAKCATNYRIYVYKNEYFEISHIYFHIGITQKFCNIFVITLKW